MELSEGKSFEEAVFYKLGEWALETDWVTHPAPTLTSYVIIFLGGIT